MTEIKLKLQPLPKLQRLIAVTYPSFDQALQHANIIATHLPTAIETIDDKIMRLVENDILYDELQKIFMGKNVIGSLSLIEFSEKSLDKLHAVTSNFLENCTFPYFQTDDPQKIHALWDLRKKCAELLGKSHETHTLIPFVEDCAVSPAKAGECKFFSKRKIFFLTARSLKILASCAPLKALSNVAKRANKEHCYRHRG